MHIWSTVNKRNKSSFQMQNSPIPGVMIVIVHSLSLPSIRSTSTGRPMGNMYIRFVLLSETTRQTPVANAGTFPPSYINSKPSLQEQNVQEIEEQKPKVPLWTSQER
jgi:hypothetical protein